MSEPVNEAPDANVDAVSEDDDREPIDMYQAVAERILGVSAGMLCIKHDSILQDLAYNDRVTPEQCAAVRAEFDADVAAGKVTQAPSDIASHEMMVSAAELGLTNIETIEVGLNLIFLAFCAAAKKIPSELDISQAGGKRMEQLAGNLAGLMSHMALVVACKQLRELAHDAAEIMPMISKRVLVLHSAAKAEEAFLKANTDTAKGVKQ